MAIPHDDSIQIHLLELLVRQHDGRMYSDDAHKTLGDKFPQLTRAEKQDPYGTNVSKWANRVRFAVCHLREAGLIQHHSLSGRGIWAISDAGRKWLSRLPDPDEILAEMMAA